MYTRPHPLHTLHITSPNPANPTPKPYIHTYTWLVPMYIRSTARPASHPVPPAS
ncbi:uncharacterized protein BDW47DRAFT_107839 [Aspergillus candidus]|uniref:Uncharacterized protein n=1 Tax=Aspergillus candidus TaxID=41067 RepID=A0A2I2F8B1_ASPCN|nr:hypothetical protein BDW47DRAFT_107839 [Aspergillus candidus]PLB36874.1 hypothetical protein BDW47DRAFT_107839 [Aspergillus candidus]